MPSYSGNGGPGGLGWQGWENAAGQRVGPGGVWDENTIYSNDYSGTIPEGARTADLGGQRQRGMYSGTTAQGLYERAQGGDPAAVSEYQQYVSRYYPDYFSQRGGGATGGNATPTTTIGQPGGPDPRQGGGRVQPQNQAQPWGNGGATDPFQGGGGGGATDPYLGGGWGGQTDPPQGGQGPRMSTQAGGYGQPDPFQGGWGGTKPSMAGRMLGSMFGQRR